jgi:hypothetical protein
MTILSGLVQVSCRHDAYLDGIKRSFRRIIENTPEQWDELLVDQDYAKILEKFPELRYGPFESELEILGNYNFPNSFGITSGTMEIQTFKSIIQILAQQSSSHPLRKNAQFIHNFKDIIGIYRAISGLEKIQDGSVEAAAFNPSAVTLKFLYETQIVDRNLVHVGWSQNYRSQGSPFANVPLKSVIAGMQSIYPILERHYNRGKLSLEERVVTQDQAIEAVEKLKEIHLPNAAIEMARITELPELLADVLEHFEKIDDAIEVAESDRDFDRALELKQKKGEMSLPQLRDYAQAHSLMNPALKLHIELLDQHIQSRCVHGIIANRYFFWGHEQYILERLEQENDPIFTYEVASRLKIDGNRMIKFGRAAGKSDRVLAPLVGFNLEVPLFAPAHNYWNYFIKTTSGREIGRHEYLQMCQQLAERAFNLGLVNLASSYQRSVFNLLAAYDTGKSESIRRLSFFEKQQEQNVKDKIRLFRKKFPNLNEEWIAQWVGFRPDVPLFVSVQNGVNYFTKTTSGREINWHEYLQRCQQLGEEALDFGLINTSINWYSTAFQLYPYYPISERLENLQKFQSRLLKN